MNHEAHKGGSVATTWLIIRPSRNCSCPLTCCTKVPNNPDHTLPINARKSKMCPQCVWKISLTIAANAVGMKKAPSKAARAATSHFTQAEMACDIKASKRIQTRLPINTSLTIHMFSANQDHPPSYLC